MSDAGAVARATAVRWAPAIGWAALIFVLSSIPDLRVAPEPTLDLAVRKAGHALVFGILALLVVRGLAANRATVAWLATTAYAISDELHQGFIVGRGPSPVDVAIDSLGAAVALLAAPLVATRLRAARRAAQPQPAERSARG